MDDELAAELLRLERALAARDWRALLAVGQPDATEAIAAQPAEALPEPIRPPSGPVVDHDSTTSAETAADVRSSAVLLAERRQAYEAVLHLAFEEIGASGRHWTRAETLALLTGAQRTAVELRDFRIAHVADGVVLALFDTGGARPVRRSSLWVRDGGRWRLRFHQGTPL